MDFLLFLCRSLESVPYEDSREFESHMVLYFFPYFFLFVAFSLSDNYDTLLTLELFMNTHTIVSRRPSFDTQVYHIHLVTGLLATT